MKAKFLRSAALEDLRSRVADNLDEYRHGSFASLVADSSLWFEHTLDVREEQLTAIKLPTGPDLYEVENCLSLYDAFAALSPYEARDERLWAYYVHAELLPYARARWPIPADDQEAVSHIQKHFFAKEKRQLERDNAASRLWWMAHLCARVPNIPRQQALSAFLYRTDVRANLIERPTTSQSAELFSAVLAELVKSYAGQRRLFDRLVFRRLMSEINSVGGFKLIDCLDEQQAAEVVSEIIQNKLGLSAT
jgi:hypothetical protein